jgi:hypothetical protein
MITALVPITGLMLAASPISAVSTPPKGKWFDRYFSIIMENDDFTSPNNEPFFKALESSGYFMTNYHAVAHPSQPNYHVTVAGTSMLFRTDFLGCSTDDHNGLCKGTTVSNGETGDNSYNYTGIPIITDKLEAAGLGWKSYSENYPVQAVCILFSDMFLFVPVLNILFFSHRTAHVTKEPSMANLSNAIPETAPKKATTRTEPTPANTTRSSPTTKSPTTASAVTTSRATRSSIRTWPRRIYLRILTLCLTRTTISMIRPSRTLLNGSAGSWLRFMSPIISITSVLSSISSMMKMSLHTMPATPKMPPFEQPARISIMSKHPHLCSF